MGILVLGLVMVVILFAGYHQIALKIEKNKIKPNGQLVSNGEYQVHVYTEGERGEQPTIVLLAGSATVAPVYDFKQLYHLLSDDNQIAVVEKAGYGYSDIVDTSRDVDSLVTELRNALIGAGIEAPYVLLPHSMSGLEALYWAQNYPNEVAGIVGLDMAVPESYQEFDFNKMKQMIFWGGTAARLGFIRIPKIYPLSTNALSKEECIQQELLMHRNAVNLDYILEGKAVYENAQIVQNGEAVSCPMLMFSSNGKQIGPSWTTIQEKFAEKHHAKLITFDCGHYLHYYKSAEMAQAIKGFMKEL